MFDYSVSRRQVGIRQRSLRRHCRAGRATELVFVLATGAVLMVGGQAQAQQQVTWTGGTGSQSWAANGNWDTGSIPLNADDVFLTTPSISAQPNIQSLGVTINSLTMSIGQIEMTNSSLTAATSVDLSGGRIIVFDGSSLIAPVTLGGTGILDMRSGGTLTGNLTIDDGGTLLNGGVLGNNMTIAGDGAGQGAIVGNSTNSFLTGTITLSDDARIGVLGGNTLFVQGTTQIGANDLTLTGLGRLEFTGGPIVGSGNLVVNGNNATLWTVSNNLTGEISLLNSDLTLLATNAIPNVSSIAMTNSTLRVFEDNSVNLLSGSGIVSINADKLLTINTGLAATTSTISADFASRGNLAVTGSGTLILTGENNRSGTESYNETTISSGTLQIGNGDTSGTLGTGDVSVADGARLDFNRSDNLTVANTITGLGNVFQTGGGTLTLTGSSRDFNVNQGTLDITTGFVNGDVALGGAGTAVNLRIGNTGAVVGTIGVAITGGSTITYGNGVIEASAINLNAPSVNLAVAANETATQSGNITTSPTSQAASVTKQGAGTLIFGGNLVYDNNAVGTVTVAGGTLDITGSVAGNVTIGAGGRLRISNSDAIAGNISTTGSVVSYGNGVTEASTLSIGSATTQLEVLAGQSATQAGVISGTNAAFGFEKIGGGLLNLSAANTYTGPTVISAGTLLVTGSITSAVTVGNNSSLDLNRGTITGNVSKTFGTSSLSGTINGVFTQNQGATVIDDGGVGGTQTTTVTGVVDIKNGTLTVNAGQTLDAQAGMLIGDGVSLSGNDVLTINGSTLGDITMTAEGRVVANSGTAIGDDALVTVNNGLLQINADETIGGLAGPGSVQLGANTLTVAGAGNTSFGGVISGTGELIQSGTGQMTMTGANTFTGAATIDGGGALAVTGAGTLATPDVFVRNNSTFMTDGGALVSSAVVRVLDSGTFRVTGNETLTGLSTLSGTTVNLDGGSVTITGNPTIAGNVIGTGGITASGATANVFLQGTNTYSGVTRIVGGGLVRVSGGAAISDTGAVDVVSGTFQLLNSETIGTLSGAGTVALNSNVLTVDGAGDSAFAGNITGIAGSGLTKSGAGMLTLTGDSTLGGATTISNGTLALGAGVEFTTASLENNSTLALGSNATLRLTANTFDNNDLTTLVDGSTIVEELGSINNLDTGEIRVEAGTGTATLETEAPGEEVNNAGLFTLTSGSLDVVTNDGAFNNDTNGNINIGAGFGALNITGTFDNDGALTVTAGGTDGIAVTGDVTTAGSLSLADRDMTVSGALAQTAGTIEATTGAVDVTGAFTQSGGGETAGTVAITAGSFTQNDGTIGAGTSVTTAGAQTLQGGQIAGTLAGTGDVTVQTGTTTLTGAGAIASGSVDIASGVLVNNSTVGLSDTADVTVSGGTWTNNQADTVASVGMTSGVIGGTAAITTGTYSQSDGELSGTVLASTSATLEGGTISGELGGAGLATVQDGTTTLTGEISADVAVAAAGVLDVTTGEVSGDLEITAGTVTSAGTLSGETTVGTLGTLTITDGTAAAVVNSGTSSSAGTVASLENLGGTFANSGTISGATQIDGGVVTNTGTMTGQIDLSGGELITSNTAGAIDNNGGTVDLAGGSTGAVTNTAGTVNVSAATFVADTFTNDAALNNTSGGNVALTLTGTGTMFTNNGTINGNLGELTITAESIELGQTSIVNGSVRLDGNTINSGVLEVSQDLLGDLTTGVTGQTTVVADVSGNGNSVSNNNAFTVAETFTLDDVDVFTNNATTVIEDNATLSAGVINNVAGSITLGANASLIGTSNTLDNDAAIIVGDGGLVEDAGEINNNAGGSIQFLGGGTLNADSDNSGDALTNRGAISSDDGGADVITLGDGDDDTIANAGGSISVGATDTFVGADVTLTNSADGEITVGLGGTLDVQTLTNQDTASIDNAGTIVTGDGVLTNTGPDATITNRATGVIDADLVTSGVVTTAGQVTGTTTVNGGSVVVNGLTGGALELVGATTVTAGTFTLTSGDVGALVNEAASDGTADITVTDGNVASLVNTSGDALLNGGEVLGTTTVTDGTVTVAGATLTGLATVNGGNYTQTSGAADGGITNNGGTVTLDGGTTASLTHTGIAGNTTITGAQVLVDATVAGGTLVVNGTTGGASEIVGTTTVTAGSFTLTAGDVGALVNTAANGVTVTSGTVASLTNNAGASQLNGGTVAGATSVSGGTVTNAGATLVGAVGVAGGASYAQSSGAAAGGITNDGGTVTLTGGTAGAVVNNTGTLSNGGTIASLTNNATASNTGTVTGDVVNTATLSSAGNVGGDLSNSASGVLTVAGASAVTGAVSNLGQVDVNALLDFGSFDNAATLNVNNGGRLTGGTLSNSGTLRVNNGGAVGSSINNSGNLLLSGLTTAGGNLSNTGSGLVTMSGTATVGGNLTNAAGARIDMANGATGDRINVGGDAVLNGTIEMDVDLTGRPDGFDQINVAGSVSGAPVIAFAPTGGEPSVLADNYDILTYGGTSALAPTTTGLPTNGAVLYQLTDVGGAFRLNSGANPAIGGLAGGLALTQSLIGSVVNRPSSPFVTGLAAPDEDPCGYGSWARATGGQADATGSSQTQLGTFEGELSADYAGFQAGFDYSCSGGTFNGWDLSFGGTLGLNDGKTTQPVFQFDPNTGGLNRNAISSINRTDFSQTYAGLYLGAARDRLFGDLQVRADRTEFDLTNVVLPGGVPLGVADQEYSSRGQTVSGSIGYSIPINPDMGLSLVPGAGFSFSNVKVGDLRFTNDPNDPTDDGLLQIDDVESRIGFVSLTLAKSKVLADEVSAISYFGTATVYEDFASGTDSRYFASVDANGNPVGAALTSTSSNLGAYGELSLGLNYTKLLEPGAAAGAKQLDASIRLDGRFSDKLDSVGLTAQMRLQF